MGPVVPLPAPRVVLEALESVEVAERSTGQSGFELSFSLSVRSPLHTLFMLAAGGTGAALPVRVVVAVTLNGRTEVLIDGVATENATSGGGEGGRATLRVTGLDLTAVMDRQDFSGLPYPAMPAEGRVVLMLLKYAPLGVIPLVMPSPMVDVDLPTYKIWPQQGTDYAYASGLAAAVGYVFYVDPGPVPGTSRAYWGPEVRIGLPQRSLALDADAGRNVTRLSFSFDHTKSAINEATKAIVVIPLPPITPLSPPLGLVPPIPTRLVPAGDDLSKQNLARGIMVGLARAARYADAVTGRGELEVRRYGAVLRPRRLVAVRGAGPAFDGLHYVTNVTHRIKRGDYRQSFELVRNGLISTLPRIQDRAA
jgi:hypothetical protein